MKNERTLLSTRARRHKGEKLWRSKEKHVCKEKKQKKRRGRGIGWGRDKVKLTRRGHDGKKRFGFHLFIGQENTINNGYLKQ